MHPLRTTIMSFLQLPFSPNPVFPMFTDISHYPLFNSNPRNRYRELREEYSV